MDVLKRKRSTLKGKTTRLSNIVIAKLENNDFELEDLNIYRDQINELWLELNDIHSEIMILCDSKETKINEDEYDEIATKIELLKIKVARLSKSEHDKSKSNSQSSENTVKLPTLQFPSFSGNYVDWISFRDLFIASIHNNCSLSNAQKLQYLKLSLKNDAAMLVQSIQISDENYERAWKIICDRFENENEIVYATLDKLFSQPNLTHESAQGLRKLLDVTNQCIEVLNILKQPTENWNAILIYFLSKKLDSETLRQWLLTESKNKMRSFEDFKVFLDQRAYALASLNVNTTGRLAPPKGLSGTISQREWGKEKKIFHSAHHATFKNCLFCRQPHSVYKCEKFLNATHNEKLEFVKKNKLCKNCLRTGHYSYSCVSDVCKICKLKHNTLLHFEENKIVNETSLPNQVLETVVSNHFSEIRNTKQVLLPTAIVKVIDVQGRSQICRVLVDLGSQTSFIREQCIQRLGIKRKPSKLRIAGVSPKETTTSNGIINVKLISMFDDNAHVNTEMHVLSKITCNLPQNIVNTKNLECFNLLKLADPKYYEPGPIDMLLGADVCSDVFLDGHIKAPQGATVAQATIFGWIIFGRAELLQNSKGTLYVHHSVCDIDVSLRKFWELEEVPIASALTNEESQCLAHFQNTHSRDNSGKYVVKLPFKEESQPLGASRDIAVSRLKQIERRFRNQPLLLEHYTKFMREYIELGHMEVVPSHEVDSPVQSTYYLPHHCVRKEDLPDNKFRVVFDASAKTNTHVSLNDNLLVGPNIQDSIFDLILRFRERKIVLKADITKMYRQVRVFKDDAEFQRIVWRESPTDCIKDYRLLTVTYGTASAPFLATKCLQQLAIDDGEAYPLAARAVLKDFYVDDLISGADTIEDAIQLQAELISLLKGGGFELRKWSSNNPSVLANLGPEVLQNDPQEFNSDESVKTLGVLWHPEPDNFSFKVTVKPTKVPATKRTLLSTLSKIFDPLGWMVPNTTAGKIIIQELWKMNLNWDDPLPNEFAERWQDFTQNLPDLENVRIPRYIASTEPLHHELHGFCDASEKAFAAVVYARIINQDGSVTTNLLASKSKVAPIKTVSLPRLELCGALLLAKLMKVIIGSSYLSFNESHCWSDSTIVLSWLASHSSRWKTFVANRVSQIHDMLPKSKWHHIRSEDNPADCASRGMSPSKLILHTLWWNGPQFLSVPSHIVNQPLLCEEINEVLLEEKKTSSSNLATEVVSSNDTVELLHRFSSLSKLKRVTAYCFRFISNCRLPFDKRKFEFLTSQELRDAIHYWIKRAQDQEFHSEISFLKNSKSLSAKSKLLPLNPFIDQEGLLRVGGRLRHSKLSPNQKHPILLPKRHILTELIIRHFHLTYLHAGPQLLLALLHQKFWIISARDIVRFHIRKCITCLRHQMQTTKQLMGDLPSARIEPARPFLKTGVDYCGPFSLRASKGRGRTTFKGYIALFVCFVTRAIHLELVSDLTTEAFLAALKRFISRRGKCSDIYSDCGTNFLGAAKRLKEIPNLPQSTKHNDIVSHFLTDQGINWHFNPPAAPHMGGLWEAGVKSVKYHLKRIIGNTILSFEEFYTVLVQIEACLNSRPLCPISSDPNDFSVLTPGHFLIGSALTAPPETDYTSTTINRLSRWQLLQKLFQHFWKRWSNEYLTRLQQRPKWLTKENNLQIGNLVLIKEDNTPPLKWRLGRVVQLFPGKDNCIRVVTVKTADGLLRRPISKLSQLPIEH